MNIPVFLAADNNYAPFVATTMASILDNTQSFVEFYVLDGGISQENKEKISLLKNQFQNFNVEFIKVNTEKCFENFSISMHLSLSTYNRLLIPSIKPQINKVVYLDVDIIVNSDIKELYEVDIENYPIAAVVDQGQSIQQIVDVKKDLSIKGEYFNAGVLLINCENWRRNDIQTKLLKIEKKYRDKIKTADQDILNCCFDNNYKIIDKKYNVMFENDIIKIRHFTSIIKPWQADFYFYGAKPKKIQSTDLFWKYAQMTPFYDEILKRKKDFLNSNILYKRLNKLAEEGKLP